MDCLIAGVPITPLLLWAVLVAMWGSTKSSTSSGTHKCRPIAPVLPPGLCADRRRECGRICVRSTAPTITTFCRSQTRATDAVCPPLAPLQRAEGLRDVHSGCACGPASQEKGPHTHGPPTHTHRSEGPSPSHEPGWCVNECDHVPQSHWAPIAPPQCTAGLQRGGASLRPKVLPPQPRLTRPRGAPSGGSGGGGWHLLAHSGRMRRPTARARAIA